MDLQTYLSGAPRRLLRSLTTLPDRRAWLELALAAACLAVVVGPLGFATGLLVYDPQPLGALPVMALTAFLVPALGEEAAFRGLLVPDRRESARAAWSVIGSTLLFGAWHVFEAAVFLPGARTLFLRPDFLAWTVVLGLACALLRRRSGSLWPAVLLHWLAVVAWKGWLGGPGLAELS